jgi:uncharacterized protein
MATDGSTARELVNDTTVNVASLLQEAVGSARTLHIRLDSFALDDDLFANDLEAEVRLTRLSRQVLADGAVSANVALECVRCLTTFEQTVETDFSEQFRQSHDVRSGIDISDHRDGGDEEADDDEEAFVIDEGHELDLAEAFRQNLLLALPMVPICGDDCPGPPARSDEDTTNEERREGQFDVLSRLLDDDTDQADT